MRTPKSIIKLRQTPRGYPIIELLAYDVDSPELEGQVVDISEKGIQISGIRLDPDQAKTFMIQMERCWGIEPFSFDAECRWMTPATDETPVLCGLEIINISEQDFLELQKVVQRFSLLDQDLGIDPFS